MKVTFVLIPSVEEQIAAGEDDVIDPAGVTLPSAPIPLFRGQNYQIPRDLMGSVNRIWLEDSRIMVEADVYTLQPSWSGLHDEHGQRLLAVGIDNAPARPR